jgi:hypothetical protein
VEAKAREVSSQTAGVAVVLASLTVRMVASERLVVDVTNRGQDIPRVIFAMLVRRSPYSISFVLGVLNPNR